MTLPRTPAPGIPGGWTCPECGTHFNRSDTHKPRGTSCQARKFAKVDVPAEQLEQVFNSMASTMYQHKLVVYRPGLKSDGNPSRTCAFAPSWAVALYEGLRVSGDVEDSGSFGKVVNSVRDDEELREAVCAVLALCDEHINRSRAVLTMLAERGLCDPPRGFDFTRWGLEVEDS